MLSSLIIGIASGAGYALMALGIVIVYKATRQFNFAQGEFGTVAVFASWLALERGLGWPIAGTIGILAGLFFGLAVERLVVRPLRGSPPVTVLVATAGVALFAIALQIIVGESKARAVSPLWDGGDFKLGANIKRQEVVLMVGLLIVAALLYLFFRAPIGTALLATSMEPFAARIAGIDINRMGQITWGMAGIFGGIAGMLFAPIGAWTPGFMTTSNLIPGFTAAVLGGITSLPGAILGGVIVGLTQSYASYLLPNVSGSGLLGVFLVLLAVLLVRPQGLLGRG